MRRGCAAGLLLVGVLALAAVAFGPRLVEEGMKLLYPRPYRDLVQREAAEFGLEEELVYGVIKAESGFDEDAQSHAGAHGLMQLTQETFDWIASLYPPEEGTGDIYDPAANLH